MEVKKAFGDIEKFQEKYSVLSDNISSYRDQLEDIKDKEYESKRYREI